MTSKIQFRKFFRPNFFWDDIKETSEVWVELKKYPDNNGANITQKSSQRVIFTLEHSLYEDDKYRKVFIDM